MAARKSPAKTNGSSKPPSARSAPAPRARPSAKASSARASTKAAAGPSKANGSRRRTPVPATKGWQLRLYVAGDSPRSRLALSNLRRLCEEKLQGDYEIEVIDLTKVPHLAKADQILAVPTLVRSIPEPMKRIIGDLSDADRALVALDLTAKGSS